MTLYARLQKKQQRIIEQEVKFILSDNGIILPQTREDLKKCKVPFGTTLICQQKIGHKILYSLFLKLLYLEHDLKF